MLIDLKSEKADKLKFDVGDVLIFKKGNIKDYCLVVMDSESRHYSLLSLKDNEFHERYLHLTNLINEANEPDFNNEFQLVEVLHKNEVVLKRVADE